MSLQRLANWTAPPGSLRPAARHTEADRKQEPEEFRYSHEHAIGGASERGFPDGEEAWLRDDDDRRPGERLNVYQCEGEFKRRDGKTRIAVHGFRSEAAYPRGEVVLTSASLWREAAALAFMASSPHDVRPAILLLFYSQDTSQLPAVLRYGTRYLAKWCERTGARRAEAACQAAAADALNLLWCRRAPSPAAARARQLCMRRADFTELRQLARRTYERRLHEAEERFTSGPIRTNQSLHSKTGKPRIETPSGDLKSPRQTDFGSPLEIAA